MKQQLIDSYQLLAERVSTEGNLTELPNEKDRTTAIKAKNALTQAILAIPSLEGKISSEAEEYRQLADELRPIDQERITLETLNREVLGTNMIDWIALTFCGSVPILQTYFLFNFLLGFPRIQAGILAFLAIFILFNYIGGGLKAAFVRIVEYSISQEGEIKQREETGTRFLLSRRSRREANKLPVSPQLNKLEWEATELLLVLCAIDAAISLGFPLLTASLVPGIEFDLSTFGLCILSLGFDYGGSRVIRQQVQRSRPALTRRVQAMKQSGDASFDSKLAKLRADFYSLRRKKRDAKWRKLQAEAKVRQNERRISSAVATLNKYDGQIIALRTTREAKQKELERSTKPEKKSVNNTHSSSNKKGGTRGRSTRW